MLFPLHIIKLQVSFSFIDKNSVLKEISCLSATKASQNTDRPVKILKGNAKYFAEFICTQFDDLVIPTSSPF